MKYLEQMQKKKLFDLAFVEHLTGNVMTAKSLLQSYKKAGYIVSIRRGLYAALDLANKNTLASRFEIGSAVNENAYISHHSALEYHGVANQVFYTVTVSSMERFTTFEYDGVTYERYLPKIEKGIQTPAQTPLVSVTDIERTVVDCIYDIGRAGGLEELLEALRLIPSLREDQLLSCLEAYGQIFLWQKAGFLLEHFSETLNLSSSFLTTCRSKINNRKKYLIEGEKMVYYPKWKLYAPRDLFNEGGDELV